MPRHNNPIPDTHGKKDQVRLIKVNFNQPAKKAKRRLARTLKAKKLFPRPVNNLLPAVACNSIKYNARKRLGRGFTLDELRAAGIHKREAPTIGITVDFRRRNHSEEGFRANVQRLKKYKSKLVLFPRGGKAPKKVADKKKANPNATTKADLLKVPQIKGVVLPLTRAKPRAESMKISEIETKQGAYSLLRAARAVAKSVGSRKKHAEKKAAEAAAK